MNENVRLTMNREYQAHSLGSAQDPRSPSLQCNYSEVEEPLVLEDNWDAPPIIADPLASAEADKLDIIEEPLQDFTPGTKETEAKITKADETLVKHTVC